MLKFIEAISEKTLRTTVALTAPRGRGKSASMGLAMASAIAFGYVIQKKHFLLQKQVNFICRHANDYIITKGYYLKKNPWFFGLQFSVI